MQHIPLPQQMSLSLLLFVGLNSTLSYSNLSVFHCFLAFYFSLSLCFKLSGFCSTLGVLIQKRPFLDVNLSTSSPLLLRTSLFLVHHFCTSYPICSTPSIKWNFLKNVTYRQIERLSVIRQTLPILVPLSHAPILINSFPNILFLSYMPL